MEIKVLRRTGIPFQLKKSMSKWIVFDIESVLVDGEYLVEIAKTVGLGEEINEITRKGLEGKITWEEGLIRRLTILKDKIRKKELEEIAYELPLMKGAVETCDEIKELGFRIAAVTGGFQFLAERIKKELNIDLVISNELIFEDERISGILLEVTSDKAKALMRYIGKRTIDIAVIDGANDLTLFNISRLKIAFNATQIVKIRADISIKEKDLRNLLKYIA